MTRAPALAPLPGQGRPQPPVGGRPWSAGGCCPCARRTPRAGLGPWPACPPPHRRSAAGPPSAGRSPGRRPRKGAAGAGANGLPKHGGRPAQARAGAPPRPRGAWRTPSTSAKRPAVHRSAGRSPARPAPSAGVAGATRPLGPIWSAGCVARAPAWPPPAQRTARRVALWPSTPGAASPAERAARTPRGACHTGQPPARASQGRGARRALSGPGPARRLRQARQVAPGGVARAWPRRVPSGQARRCGHAPRGGAPRWVPPGAPGASCALRPQLRARTRPRGWRRWGSARGPMWRAPRLLVPPPPSPARTRPATPAGGLHPHAHRLPHPA